MEAVLKNLESTVELLAVSQTEMVKQWDKQTLDRAIQWARYCEHLYSRFHANPAISEMLEKQLQLTNERLRTTFQGYTDITFSELSQCQHLLLAGLLKNPAVPSLVIKPLFESSSSHCRTAGDKEATGLCTELIEYKSACKVLGTINLRRSATTCGPEADVQGMMLMGRLDTLLRPGSKVGLAEQFLDSVLQTGGGVHKFSRVIAAVVMSSCHEGSVSGVSMDFLMDWLQRNHCLLQHMCSTLPIGLLKDLAQQSLKFRVAYCCVLKERASHMEYDINEGEWIQACANGMSFKTMIDHFRSLLEACPSLKEDTEKELTALKVADGDFDVRGLSIWSDILSELM